MQLNGLMPGRQVKVRLTAQSENSDESAFEHWLVFHPPLPDVVTTAKTHDELQSKVVMKRFCTQG